MSKATQSPDQKSIDKAASLLNEPAAAIQANSQGKLYSNAKMSDASLMDMFQGDKVGDTAYVDVSKLQMFYFTVIAILAYAYAVYRLFLPTGNMGLDLKLPVRTLDLSGQMTFP